MPTATSTIRSPLLSVETELFYETSNHTNTIGQFALTECREWPRMATTYENAPVATVPRDGNSAARRFQPHRAHYSSQGGPALVSTGLYMTFHLRCTLARY
jgi:hypothetical protein